MKPSDNQVNKLYRQIEEKIEQFMFHEWIVKTVSSHWNWKDWILCPLICPLIGLSDICNDHSTFNNENYVDLKSLNLTLHLTLIQQFDIVKKNKLQVVFGKITNQLC